MGVVYQAEDTRLRRKVAIKLLSPQLSDDPAAKARFLREARAAATLDHPNIAAVHDVGESPDGRMFLAMAYYDGETIKKKIERGPLPIAQSLDLAEQIARGLAAAHERGIVHRDIKPANVMVTVSGERPLDRLPAPPGGAARHLDSACVRWTSAAVHPRSAGGLPPGVVPRRLGDRVRLRAWGQRRALGRYCPRGSGV